jgi:hypothetical protein
MTPCCSHAIVIACESLKADLAAAHRRIAELELQLAGAAPAAEPTQVARAKLVHAIGVVEDLLKLRTGSEFSKAPEQAAWRRAKALVAGGGG